MLRQISIVLFLFYAFFLIVILFPQKSTAARTVSNSIQVQMNDVLLQFQDAKPMIDDRNHILVPLRFISEKLGYKVFWNKVRGETTVSLENGEQSIKLFANKDTALLNGHTVQLDAQPFVAAKRIYVPLRFIGETSGVDVAWSNELQLAILNEDGKSHPPIAVEHFKATAYSAAPEENGRWGAVDYFGNPLRLGTVAVDPEVIPLGTKLYITGYNFDGLPAAGLKAIAADTGSAIKGNRIDIFVPGSHAKVSDFGFQKVKIYILKN